MRAAVYCGTRNLYKDMITAAKSLLIHSNVEQIYFLIEDDIFPYELTPKTTTINISNQTYFDPEGPNFNSSWTYMVLIRAALTKVFPQLDTILSLDVDTIVNENISDLWNTKLDDYYLAAVREPEKSTKNTLYINMGVALLNLKKLRDDKKDDEIIHSLNTIQYDYNEQDCINKLCQGKILELNPDYNITNYTEEAKHRKIIHYAAIKEWQKLPLVQHYANMTISKINQPDQFGLDIIIPTYNDKKGLIRTLKSIDSKSNKIRITVIDDCSSPSYQREIKKLFPKVNFFSRTVNQGPGAARQLGINITSNPYIMFIDSDDYLLPMCLDLVLKTIQNNTMPDLYLFRWLNEETNQFSGEWNPLMHGWVYKREFLKIYNIDFCAESSYSNEDIGFNHTCDMILKHIATYDNTLHKLFCETPIYMYTYNKNSITHANKKEFLFTKQTYGLAMNGLHIVKKGLENEVNKDVFYEKICHIMFGLYEDFLRCLSRPELLQDNWDNIRCFYKQGFEPYEHNCSSALSIMMGQHIKTLMRRSIKEKVPINIQRFLRELKDNEYVPLYYYTK